MIGSKLMAIDPGLRGCGFALFGRDGVLDLAQYISNTGAGAGPFAWKSMSDAVSDQVSWVWPGEVVIELPQVYRESHRTKRGADPNDLIQLGALVGAIAARFSDVTTYLPHTWKGNIKKEVMAKRILARLTPIERTRIEHAGHLDHNIIDAIGLGLYHLGRLEPRRVIAR